MTRGRKPLYSDPRQLSLYDEATEIEKLLAHKPPKESRSRFLVRVLKAGAVALGIASAPVGEACALPQPTPVTIVTERITHEEGTSTNSAASQRPGQPESRDIMGRDCVSVVGSGELGETTPTAPSGLPTEALLCLPCVPEGQSERPSDDTSRTDNLGRDDGREPAQGNRLESHSDVKLPTWPKPVFPEQAYSNGNGTKISAHRKALWELVGDKLQVIDEGAKRILYLSPADQWVDFYRLSLERERNNKRIEEASTQEEPKKPAPKPDPKPKTVAEQRAEDMERFLAGIPPELLANDSILVECRVGLAKLDNKNPEAFEVSTEQTKYEMRWMERIKRIKEQIADGSHPWLKGRRLWGPDPFRRKL